MRFPHVTLGLLFGGLLLTIASSAAAQNAAGFGTPFVPIHGHTGIIQEPINTAEMYAGVNRIADVLDLASRKPAKIYKMEALGNIDRGMPVTVQYADDTANAVATSEGTVTSVDRVHGRIGVKYDDGRSETLRVTEHPAPSSGTFEVKGKRVVVSSSNKSGQQVLQYFKRTS